VHPLAIVEARAIGVMYMRDGQDDDDHKIIAVNVHDPAFSDYTTHDALPPHTLREVRRFFEDYKALEHKTVVVDAPLGADRARRVVREALEAYRGTFTPTP
jgi:inorganic pyrophosphatase